MKPESISCTPFFTFSSGELERAEFTVFFDKLRHTLKRDEWLVVIMGFLDDLNLNTSLLKQLSFADVDFHSTPQGVLYYREWSTVEQDLWLLLQHAEPEFIFNCASSFEALLLKLRRLYPQEREGLEYFSVLKTLTREFSPVLLNRSGEFTCLSISGPGPTTE